MIRLIITADDWLYQLMARRARKEGDTPGRAVDALTGLEKATDELPGLILLDMTLRSADTLLQTLRCRSGTAEIPILALTRGVQLPFELRRLCTGVIDVSGLANNSPGIAP